MSIATMILGESGTGKSASLRNIDPNQALLIQAVKKPLPFKSKGWSYRNKEINPKGNIFSSDNSAHIVYAMNHTEKDIIIIDDFQYILANEFMRRVTDQEKGNAAFQKYNEIAKSAWDILMAANSLAENKRVYILAHTQTESESEGGRIKVKTIGKLLDEKITPEGLLTIVFRTAVINGQYLFSTQNNGKDTVKTPMGMFADLHIDNDLAAVDAAICDFYNLNQSEQSEIENESNT
jgi:hypothetical protein